MKRAVLATALATLLPVAGSLYVTATYGGSSLPVPAVTAREPLRLVEGIPVVRLAGTHREIGRAHGTILREQIRFLRREFFHAVVAPMVGERAMRRWAREVEPFIPPEYAEELRGIAEGAEIPYEEMLHFNTAVDLLQSMMCSTVVAAGEATAGGEVLFGRNLDFPGRGVLHRTSVVLVFEPEGKTPVAAVTWPGLVGTLSGMNAEGVAGATMMIHRSGPAMPGIPYMMMYRRALETARRAADAYESIAGSRRTCPNNFMAVDATGAAEVTEFTPETAIRRAASDGCLCSTNYFVSEALRGKAWSIGTGRYDDLAGFLRSERGRIDLKGILGALRTTARPWFMNVQSMVFLPARRALWMAVPGELPAADAPFVLLDRECLFGGP